MRYTFFVLCCVFLLASGQVLFSRYQARVELTNDRLANLTDIYSENTQLLMNSVESILHAMQIEVNQEHGEGELNLFLQSIGGWLPQLRTLIVLDANGTVIGDSREAQPALGMSAADRVYFLVHQRNPHELIYVDNPVQSRVDGKWSMPVSLGVWEEGEFEGVVAASIDPKHFTGPLSLLEPNNVGLKGFIANQNGVILATIPHDNDIIGVSIENNEIFSRIENGEVQGGYSGEGITSSNAHYVAFHQIESDHLIVIFTQSQASAIAPFYMDVGLTGVIFLVLMGMTYWLLQRQSTQSQEIVIQANLVRRERNILRTLIENIPADVYIKDRSGKILATNMGQHTPPFEDDTIVTSVSQPDGITIQELHSDDDIMQTGQGIYNEEHIVTIAKGKRRWLLLTKVPLVRQATDEVIGLVGISRDITNLRQAEEELLQAETMRLEIEQERELIKLKQRFMSTATHDFRTPLTIIKSSVEILDTYHDRITEERRKSKLNQISEQVSLMVRLIDDVMTISKADAGKIVPEYETIPLRAFCEHTWHEIVEIDRSTHRAHFEFLSAVETIHVDPNLLQLALMNLLSNAFKYTPEGGKVIFRVLDDAEAIVIQVQDTGRGIPPEEQEQLFQAFFRASNTDNITGTGLGLVIAKSYIELHGGTITCESSVGDGTTFTVTLPPIDVATTA